jgi:cytochrome c553
MCAGCHATNQLAPTLSNSRFQKSASDELILRTISGGRSDTAMPAFQRPGADGLSDQDLNDLLAHIRTLGSKSR